MISPFLYFAPKLFCSLFISLLICLHTFTPYFAGRFFFLRCFTLSGLVCIVWSSWEIFLVFLLSIISFRCIVCFDLCCFSPLVLTYSNFFFSVFSFFLVYFFFYFCFQSNFSSRFWVCIRVPEGNTKFLSDSNVFFFSDIILFIISIFIFFFFFVLVFDMCSLGV